MRGRCPACQHATWGHALLIKDQTGADAGRAELTEFDGVTNATRDIVVKAPVGTREACSSGRPCVLQRRREAFHTRKRQRRCR